MIKNFNLSEPIKLPVFYFLLAAAFAGWQSLFNVHLDGIGFSSLQIGGLNAIFISTSALVVPFWSMIIIIVAVIFFRSRTKKT